MKGNTNAHNAVSSFTCITCHEGTPKYTWYGVSIVTKAVGHEGRKAGQDCISSGCHSRSFSKFNGMRIRPVLRSAILGSSPRLLPDGLGLGPDASAAAGAPFNHQGVTPRPVPDLPQRAGGKGPADQAPRDAPVVRQLPQHRMDASAVQPPGFAGRPGCQVCHNGNSASGKSSGHFFTTTLVRLLPPHAGLGAGELFAPCPRLPAAGRQTHLRELPHHQRRNHPASIARWSAAQAHSRDTGSSDPAPRNQRNIAMRRTPAVLRPAAALSAAAAFALPAQAQLLEDLVVMPQGNDTVARIGFSGTVRFIQQSPTTPAELYRISFELVSAEESVLNQAIGEAREYAGSAALPAFKLSYAINAGRRMKQLTLQLPRKMAVRVRQGPSSRAIDIVFIGVRSTSRRCAGQADCTDLRQALRRAAAARAGGRERQAAADPAALPEPRDTEHELDRRRRAHAGDQPGLLRHRGGGRSGAQGCGGTFPAGEHRRPRATQAGSAGVDGRRAGTSADAGARCSTGARPGGGGAGRVRGAAGACAGARAGGAGPGDHGHAGNRSVPPS